MCSRDPLCAPDSSIAFLDYVHYGTLSSRIRTGGFLGSPTALESMASGKSIDAAANTWTGETGYAYEHVKGSLFRKWVICATNATANQVMPCGSKFSEFCFYVTSAFFIQQGSLEEIRLLAVITLNSSTMRTGG